MKYVLIGIVLFVLGSAGLNYISKNMAVEEQKGFVISRTVVIKNCADEALKTEGISQAVANQYCGCVYDNGYDQFGGEKLTNELIKIEKTNEYSPEMTNIINQCLEQI